MDIPESVRAPRFSKRYAIRLTTDGIPLVPKVLSTHDKALKQLGERAYDDKDLICCIVSIAGKDEISRIKIAFFDVLSYVESIYSCMEEYVLLDQETLDRKNQEISGKNYCEKIIPKFKVFSDDYGENEHILRLIISLRLGRNKVVHSDRNGTYSQLVDALNLLRQAHTLISKYSDRVLLMTSLDSRGTVEEFSSSETKLNKSKSFNKRREC